MSQLDLHNRIDEIINSGFSTANQQELIKIISVNEDAKRYFFLKANETWIDWLWKNSFLDKIKENHSSDQKLQYRMPELDYLVNVSIKCPEKVVDIILSIDSSPDHFNPEVIDRFLWIASELSAKHVVRLIDKIKSENWVKLMCGFNKWGFEYEKIVKNLFESKNYEAAISLIDTILTVRTKEESVADISSFTQDNPFYFDDIGQIELFSVLSEFPESYNERILELATKKMSEIILMSDKKSDSDSFTVGDFSYLFDVDFYTIELNKHMHHSYRDYVYDLAAIIKEFSKRVVGGKCGNHDSAIALYKKYIDSMPLSQSMWRLRLFVVSLCPEAFKGYIREYLFRVFEQKDQSLDLVSGAEYEQLLKNCFSYLDQEYRDKYIKNIIDFFGDDKKEKYYKDHGVQILSCINQSLSPEQKADIESVFKAKTRDDYNPEPIIGRMRSGAVASRAPIDLTVLSGMSIKEIADKLKSDWSPKNIYETDKVKDLFNPFNAEGMGLLIQQDINRRFDQYVENAPLFFDRDNLDEHYTYALLQGIYNVLRENRYPSSVNYENLVRLFEDIISSNNAQNFKIESRGRSMYNSWLANWNAVFNSTADIIKELLGEDKPGELLDFTSLRIRVLSVIKNLLLFPDPNLEDNTRPNGSDPFTTAINSVRGKTLQSLMLLMGKDDKEFKKEERLGIEEDVKLAYEELLEREDTYAIMFEYGHYLALLYSRDKEWCKGLFSKIFPTDNAKHDLLIASLEGYFSSSLYGDLFNDLQDIYKLAISLKPEEYTSRKYFKEVGEGLATHLALAFIHFPTFTVESELFKLFWESGNKKGQKEFISFIGRHIVSKDNPNDYITKNNIDKAKIGSFWDWAITNIIDQEVLSGFGFWMNTEHEVFDNVWIAERIYKTLGKSNGLVEWEYGLMKSLVSLAKSAPESTLKILEAYLDSRYISKSLDNFRDSLYIDQEIIDTFKTLYNTASTKEGTYKLIDQLVGIGNGRFWKLKEALK